MLPKAHLTSHSRLSGSWWVIIWVIKTFLSSSYTKNFLVSSVSVRSLPFPLSCPSLHEMFPWYLQFSLKKNFYLAVHVGSNSLTTDHTRVPCIRSSRVLALDHQGSKSLSNFLEEISSLTHSIVFLYFFALSIYEGLLMFPCYSLELFIQLVYL